MTAKKSSVLIWGTLLGNLFEHYDTALYALLSPFLAPQFFPNYDPLTALLLTYGIIPLGMLIRPIGSLVFGYIGDTYGRQKSLVISLVGMAIVTVLIAWLPTYKHVGAIAPIILSFAKLLQNFFSAGETIGGAVYLLENTDAKKHNLLSSLYGAASIGGILLASLGVTILGLIGNVETGWRFLYLIGGTTAFFAWILRLNMDPDVFPQRHKNTLREILRGLWEMRRTAFAIAVAAGFSYATYTVALVMLNGFIPLVSNVTKEQVIHINTFLLVLDFITLPLFGLLANKISKEKMMIAASAVATFGGIPLFLMLENGSIATIVAVRICLVLIGVCYSATFYSWSQELVPPAVRYTIIGFAYSVGSQLFGSPTAVISLWLFQKSGIPSSTAWYWVLLSALSIYVLLKKYEPVKIKEPEPQPQTI